MLVSSGPYQRHLWLTSTGALASSVYDVSHNVTSYFYLRTLNNDLEERNGELQSEIAMLRSELRKLQEHVYGDTVSVDDVFRPYDFIVASVINNSVAMPQNYITLNKGLDDGVKPEMGVIDANGVVGVVSQVTSRHARVISMLNPNFRLSCKVKGSDAFGSLVWYGKDIDEVVLEELPRHAVYMPGDTVITSGFSSVFPEGVPIGTVVERLRDEDDNFFKLRVKLFIDFPRLSTVMIVINNDVDEME